MDIDPVVKLLVFAVAFVLAAIDVFQSGGRSLTSWAAALTAGLLALVNWP